MLPHDEVVAPVLPVVVEGDPVVSEDVVTTSAPVVVLDIFSIVVVTVDVETVVVSI